MEVVVTKDVEPIIPEGVVDPRVVRDAVEKTFADQTPQEFLEDFWKRKPDIAQAAGFPKPEELKP
ncbi:MAG TPA: hypothetical protein VEB18_00170 [Candidatus Paceibacterota bacterium]|nr:hypothetical protein [Candidatus Paceibacterota bacterium]